MFSLMVNYAWSARCAVVAGQLKIPDFIAEGCMSATDISTACGTHPDFTYRLLRALASAGIFEEDKDGFFKNNAMSNVLRRRHPMYDGIMHIHGPMHSAAWQELLHCIKTGENGTKKVYGCNWVEYLQKDPIESELFNKSMVAWSAMFLPAMVDRYDWSPYKMIVDVGGGHGGVVSALLKKK